MKSKRRRWITRVPPGFSPRLKSGLDSGLGESCVYTQVIKTWRNNRVIKVTQKRVIGTAEQLQDALKFGKMIRTPAMQAGLVSRRMRFRDIFRAVDGPGTNLVCNT